MQVLNPRASLLSNYEVLTLLKDLEADYLARAKTALRIKKEEEAAGTAHGGAHDPLDDVAPNLRTIELEAIPYLSAPYQPTRAQSAPGIARLTRSLAAYALTKPEKLQIVNLAPTAAVELYVIVEELEDRLGDKMDDVLDHVRASLSDPDPALAPASHLDTDTAFDYGTAQPLYQPRTAHWAPDAPDAPDADVDVEFVDAGEGMGVEGDLDVDADDDD